MDLCSLKITGQMTKDSNETLPHQIMDKSKSMGLIVIQTAHTRNCMIFLIQL